jgi:hypothetical protein
LTAEKDEVDYKEEGIDTIDILISIEDFVGW